MNSCGLVTFVSAVACSMSNCYTEEELEILAAIFIQLGYSLETIITNEARIERCLHLI